MTPRLATPTHPIADHMKLPRAAAYFDLSERTLRRYIAAGKLPGYRVAGTRTIRVRVSDVAALLEPIPTTAPVASEAEQTTAASS